ncbi:hypothetical protein [Streptomyces sp. NPDC046985]
MLSALGTRRGRQRLAQIAARTPLPPSGVSSTMQSDVLWV